MSQHDMIIDNAPGASVRADINLALQALASNSMGPSAPVTPYAGQPWLDTSGAKPVLKLRNTANTGWLVIGTVDQTNGIYPQYEGQVVSPYSGFKNRLINGAMRIAQRAASATITAGGTIAAGYATVDRFYAYCTGANVTMAQVNGAGSTMKMLQFTGAAGVTGIGFGQRIEQQNSYDMAGSVATLSVDLSNSLLTTVTWTAYYANTADTFGTLAAPTRTQIATGTFTVNATKTRYKTNIAIPAAATTGIEIVFTVGAQTSGTWKIDDIQLELGAVDTPFEVRPYSTELALCQRYYEIGETYAQYHWDSNWGAGSASAMKVPIYWRVAKRATPTVTGSLSGAGWTGVWAFDTPNYNYCTFYNSATINVGSFASYANWVATSEL